MTNGYALTGTLLTSPGMRGADCAVSRARTLSQPCRHDAASIRCRRVQIFFAARFRKSSRSCATSLYPRLAPVANRWSKLLDDSEPYPASLAAFIKTCAAHGQLRPTPLLLNYEAGGYNCLHQDLYGEVAFPLQFTCVLSRRDRDFEGGEFLLVEQRPRAQSRGEAISMDQGEGIIFTNRYRPVAGTRGHYRVNVRHGVSTLRDRRALLARHHFSRRDLNSVTVARSRATVV